MNTSQTIGAQLVAVIGDEDTVTGFLLAGIGSRDGKAGSNFYVVHPEKTLVKDIEDKFRSLTNRKDIAIILINQNIAHMIRHLLNQYTKTIPTVLEIPSKDSPYDEDADPIMQRVLGLLGRGR